MRIMLGSNNVMQPKQTNTKEQSQVIYLFLIFCAFLSCRLPLYSKFLFSHWGRMESMHLLLHCMRWDSSVERVQKMKIKIRSQSKWKKWCSNKVLNSSGQRISICSILNYSHSTWLLFKIIFDLNTTVSGNTYFCTTHMHNIGTHIWKPFDKCTFLFAGTDSIPRWPSLLTTETKDFFLFRAKSISRANQENIYI